MYKEELYAAGGHDGRYRLLKLFISIVEIIYYALFSYNLNLDIVFLMLRSTTWWQKNGEPSTPWTLQDFIPGFI